MIEKNNKQLDSFLLNFLKPFRVQSKEFNDLKERLGIDALGATDVLNKLIWYNKDREIDTLPEEASHMIVMLMGENNPIIKSLLQDITTWSEYKSIYDTYMPIYKNEKQVKIEAVGKLVANAIVKNFKESGLDRSLLQRALKLINDFFDKISNILKGGQGPFFNSDRLADKIAINVLSGNSDFVSSIVNTKLQLDYQKALANNIHANNIIQTFTKLNHNFKLTGSLAIAGQGEKIYRPEDEPIHDLDFVVKYGTDIDSLRNSLQSLNAVPVHYGWKSNNYTTEAYYIPAKGYEVKVLGRRSRDGYAGKGNIKLIETSTRKVVPIDANNLIAVDFFIYNKPNSEVNKDIFTSWQDIYGGKLGLSPLMENERMFQREKDQEDYVLSTPKDLSVFKPEFVYYQTKELPASRASKETLEIMKASAKKMGVSIEALTDYLKNTSQKIKGVAGVADLMRGVIAIAQGKEDVALTEELVHVATAILEQTDPQLVTSMIAKISRFKIYNEVLKQYSDRKEYQLPNGKPDIRKIKKEAVDKLIAELIIYNNEGSTEFPELMKEENRSLVSTWWDTILDYLRKIYSRSNIDIFQTASQKIMAGEVGGTVADIDSDELFLQVKNDAVDKIYDRYLEEDKKLKLIPAITDASGKIIKKRHYTYDGKDVDMSVTEKTKGAVNYERTEAQKIADDMKKDWGSEGHAFIDKYIQSTWIDKDGYRKETPTYSKIQSKLSSEIQGKLEAFCDKLIKSYPAGTRFLLEKKVVNTKVKGMIASTVDFVAIITQADGSAKMDILDWKFS
jgi:hypothetical protein